MLAALDDRLPPQALESEAYILGAVLRDNAAIDDVVMVLEVDDFYRDAHQVMYRHILALWDRQGRVDAPMLLDELTRFGKVERVGGHEGIADVLRSAPHEVNVRYHAEIVREKSRLRALISACNHGLEESYRQSRTADDTIDSVEANVIAIRSAASVGNVSAREAALRAMTLFASRQDGEGLGIPTGLAAVDSVIGGLRPGCVYVIAGRPGSGKTSMALQLADHAAVDLGHSTLVVSLEMGVDEPMLRMIGARARVDGDLLSGSRKANPDEFARMDHAYKRLALSPLQFDGHPVHNAAQIAANARRHRSRADLRLLVIDYLQLIDPEDAGRESRQEQIAKISRRMKTLAINLEIPIVMLSQLNRQSEKREDKRPQLADLRESGAVEQDADVVLMIHRPDYYDPADSPGLAEIGVFKNRYGPTALVKMRFCKEQTRFDEWDTMGRGSDEHAF